MLTKKDFITYLAHGGDVNFNKAIQFNKVQLSKLTKDQREGRQVVIINGREGYMGGDGTWTPKAVK